MNFDHTRFNLVSLLLAAAALGSACGGADNEDSSADSDSAPLAAERRSSSALAVSSTWTLCAKEGATCVFTGSRQVRYGTTTKYATKTLSGGAACNNGVFGDPAYGVGKSCWYETITNTPDPVVNTPVVTTPTGTTWKQCATENGTCSFSGSRQVKYGTVTQNVTKTFTNAVLCGNTTFGDPAYGVGKTCWVAEVASVATPAGGGPAGGTTTNTGTNTGSNNTGSTGGPAPTPASIAGKAIVGRITAATGQIIENVHVTTTNGPCIVVPAGVTNVIIRNSEIGPCGSREGSLNNEGVHIFPGASNITVQRNVIHDVSAAFRASSARHPLVFDRNFVYNIRGPIWQGNMVQFGEVRGGSGSSKITCNVKDGEYRPGLAIGQHTIGDHISMYNTLGVSNDQPIEIAYNRILGDPNGNNVESGSGMQLGDGANGSSTSESGFYWVHHNTVVRANGGAIGVAGGHDIRVEHNVLDQRAPSQSWNTGWALGHRNFSTNLGCYNIAFTGNRLTVANLWAFNRDGSAGAGIAAFGSTCQTTLSGNNFNDAGLASQTYRQIFDTPYSQCN